MNESLVRAYLHAKEQVIKAGFTEEIDYHEDLSFNNVSESDFLREAAWVILSSGMRESVVRLKFGSISKSFMNWESSTQIASKKDSCYQRAFHIFRHSGKINAIITVAETIAATGFTMFRKKIEERGTVFLRQLPYLGPATSFHLAKNIGLDVVKPDRHLLRISSAAGFNCPDALCRSISAVVGEKISIIDLVLWRFANLYPTYLCHFKRQESAKAGSARFMRTLKSVKSLRGRPHRGVAFAGSDVC